MRTSAFVLAKAPDGALVVLPRAVWPKRGFTFVSSHRTREAADEAKAKAVTA